MKTILTIEKSSRIKAGVEIFNDQLCRVFRDMEIYDYEKAGKTTEISILREPLIARKICKSFMQREKKPDIVFSNGMYGWALEKKKLGIPVISIMHGGYSSFAEAAMQHLSLNYFRVKYLYSYFEMLSAKKADLVVSNSTFTAHNIKRDYGVESIVINNSIDTDLFRPMGMAKARKILGLPQDKKIALFVGRPDYSKGFDIIEALAASHKDIIFACVINPRVVPKTGNMLIFGNIERDTMPLFYSAADVCINPSRFEGFGYVPLEALSCNTPVISGRVGILSEIDSVNCILINGNSPEKYSECLCNIPDKLNSRKEIARKFSFSLFKKRYTETVSRLL